MSKYSYLESLTSPFHSKTINNSEKVEWLGIPDIATDKSWQSDLCQAAKSKILWLGVCHFARSLGSKAFFFAQNWPILMRVLAGYSNWKIT